MELVNGLILQPGVADHPLEAHKIWQRSRKSAYNAFFLEGFAQCLGKGFGKLGPPYGAKFSFGLRWKIDAGLLIALPSVVFLTRPSAHCDQAEESIQHLLVSCVCARHVWIVVLQKLGFILRAPQANTNSFSSWWCQAIKICQRKSGKASILSSSWWHGKYGSTRMNVFLMAWQSYRLQVVADECVLWCSAGAKDLQELLVRAFTGCLHF